MWYSTPLSGLTPDERVGYAVAPFVVAMLLRFLLGKTQFTRWTIALGTMWFAINVLRAGQEELAAVFASKRVQAEKFDAACHSEQGGVPVLDDALAWLVCDLEELLPRGDHTIGVGAVTELATFEGEPLVFHRGGYWGLTDPASR